MKSNKLFGFYRNRIPHLQQLQLVFLLSVCVAPLLDMERCRFFTVQAELTYCGLYMIHLPQCIAAKWVMSWLHDLLIGAFCVWAQRVTQHFAEGDQQLLRAGLWWLKEVGLTMGIWQCTMDYIILLLERSSIDDSLISFYPQDAANVFDCTLRGQCVWAVHWGGRDVLHFENTRQVDIAWCGKVIQILGRLIFLLSLFSHYWLLLVSTASAVHTARVLL